MAEQLAGEYPPNSYKGIRWTGGSITRLSLHKRAATASRLDVLPFIFIYTAALFFVVFYRISQFFTIALFTTLIMLHILSLLVQHWSVKIKAFMSWNSISTVSIEDVKAGIVYALCQPREHRGSPELVPLECDEKSRIYFVFQKRVYEYDSEATLFEKVLYPTHLTLRHYTTYARKTNGLGGDQLLHFFTRFGLNKLDMPAPTFSELYKKALLAPFFVFQVFCVFLWLLDEYWKYSLMTLVMMLIFEATVVHGRLKSLKELRGMRNAAVNVNVFREKKWRSITSLELLPGDIVSITRGKTPAEVVPCDVLMLSGSVVVNESMLTGESVPLMKEGLSDIEEQDLDKCLSIKDAHKSNVLFGGTRVLTSTTGPASGYTPSVKAPDGGCVCYVLRSGFGSSQGKLMRTILFSTESVSANSMEAALFILFLLVFAIAASGYVLCHRYTTDADGRYKLLLRCVLIITSVVPPELPMQLALAVNTSLIALVRNLIFCTEPFRIPYAGKVDICCFDKTGTLTTDSINAVGVVHPSTGDSAADDDAESGEYKMLPVADSSINASLVLAACHSLVHVDNELIGDPLELAALESVEWNYGRTETAVPKKGGSGLASAKILKRFRFASALQRMSVIADVKGNSPRNGPRVLVKGSPEAIGKLLSASSAPTDYSVNARRLARAGMRVLALAYKDLEVGLTSSQAAKLNREEAESELTFAGFVCFECPLRTDSRKVIRMLKKANHIVSMITGDATLTAAHVATQVGMCTKRILILNFSEVNPGTLEWFSANSGNRLKRFAVDSIKSLAKEFDLCASGPALQAALDKHEGMREQLKHIKVYARMSPDQKENVLTSLKECGLVTLMCGDGTNDVGALKQAHVGVALLSGHLSTAKKPRSAGDDAARAQVIGGSNAGSSSSKGGKSSGLRQRKKGTSKSSSSKSKTQSSGEAKDAYARKMEELSNSLGEADDQAPLVKLGDASIASPFTSRRMTIDSCASIIRQGRCTLATTLQMYQILALNCLISAYSLSVLYLEGVMLGDKQMTITGLVLTVASFMVSRSKPLKRLSPERPESSVFAPGLFLSLMGQFAIHVAAMIACMEIVRPYLPVGYKVELDEEFTPSLMNSVIFLLTIAQQISVYVVNYKGRPFMQGIFENRALLYSLLCCGGILAICTAEVSKELNEFMELVAWPTKDLQMSIAAVIIFDIMGTIVIGRICGWLFKRRVEVVE